MPFRTVFVIYPPFTAVRRDLFNIIHHLIWGLGHAHQSKVGQTDLVFGVHSLVGLCMQDHKSLCAAVTISVTVVDPKFDFYILTSVTLKSRSNQIWICHSVHTCHMLWCTYGANLLTSDKSTVQLLYPVSVVWHITSILLSNHHHRAHHVTT